MSELVSGEMTLSLERLFAGLALERPVLSVCYFMPLKVRGPSEMYATERASVALLSCTNGA